MEVMFATRLLVIGALVGLVAGCTSSPPKNSGLREGSRAVATIVSPKDGAKDVPAGLEIQFTVQDAASTQVELKDAAGAVVAGAMGADGTAWVPAGQLKYKTGYTATVTATDDRGIDKVVTASFTTMAQPGNRVRVSSVVGDDMVVGIGMPMIIQFGRDVPDDLRATVQKRMTVKSEPAQEGSWHWFSDREAHYRPKEFWQPGTKLDMKVLTGGLPLGGGWYGRADLSVVAEIAPALQMTIDNATKQMTVTEGGTVTRTIPISLGRPGMPSSSGTMIVMERLAKTVFDTRSDPNPANRYRVDIEYAQRLTWAGEFIHAAPWSVEDQGKRNVSHGCVNMSTEDAKWLFDRTHLGDPVTIKGTERTLQYGNGWTDWSMTWEQYVAGSAIR